MNSTEISQWIAQAEQGQLSWTEVAERLLRLEYAAGSEHRPDSDRGRRCGFGEVIFGMGKSVEDIVSIANRLLDCSQDEVLVTRVARATAVEVSAAFAGSRYDEAGRTLRLSRAPVQLIRIPSPALRTPPVRTAPVCVVTAGSTDRPVGCEALETLRWMGVDAELICDVGVAGPYRLLAHIERLRGCAALVVVAGMEGALASVVGGLVPCPIIAVPTSVGYGANLEGITTLLSMLSSCAAGVTVVNIDAGFKGGYVAGLIATSGR